MATLRAQEEKADGTNRVIVSKQDMRITVLCPQGDTLAVFPIACGRNYGDKQQEWDFRTPEGHFVIESVEDTSLWPRDSTRQETPGEIYGPRFFRLKTPGFTGIGIHGTANPQVIPGRITMGCIRLSNEDLKAFSRLEQDDLDVHVSRDGEDELGQLASGFNHMVLALKANRQELVENQRELNQA